MEFIDQRSGHLPSLCQEARIRTYYADMASSRRGYNLLASEPRKKRRPICFIFPLVLSVIGVLAALALCIVMVDVAARNFAFDIDLEDITGDDPDMDDEAAQGILDERRKAALYLSVVSAVVAVLTFGTATYLLVQTVWEYQAINGSGSAATEFLAALNKWRAKVSKPEPEPKLAAIKEEPVTDTESESGDDEEDELETPETEETDDDVEEEEEETNEEEEEEILPSEDEEEENDGENSDYYDGQEEEEKVYYSPGDDGEGTVETMLEEEEEEEERKTN